MEAVSQELGAILQVGPVGLDTRLAALWFRSSLRPLNWVLPSSWDSIAGDYQTQDGWIRLHTNAPHHRAAATKVLNGASDRDAVSKAVLGWSKEDLETAIVGAGGAAAAMRRLDDWAAHPQGVAVASEPLIAWTQVGEASKDVALKGLKVLDLTRVLAGPVATRVLAGFGAHVLRIDPPWWHETAVEMEVTLGKTCAGLDLTCAPDRETFEALLKDADVLVHGYRKTALETLGYDSETLMRLAPGLIDVALTAYGWTGPWTGRRGFDSLVQMSTGIAAEGMVRSGSDAPKPLPVQALDHATGYLMAASVLRAVSIRREEGICSSARLSLARTAALLTSEGAHPYKGEDVSFAEDDFLPEIEETGWGPANRLRFPITVAGRGPEWRYPARPLRSDRPVWPQT